MESDNVPTLIRQQEHTPARFDRGLALFGGGILATFLLFLLLPGDIASKAHAALHGLCAQRPSHSLWMGGTPLPLDARMTGIYLGAAVTGAWLLVAGRLRARGPLSHATVITLGLGVLVMALDGGNALLVDLALPHPYEPSNRLRLITGSLAGIALGVGLGYLFAITIWERGERDRSVVGTPRELVVPLVGTLALGALAMSGLPILYAPFAVGLVGAAVMVFWTLAMVLLALIGNLAWSYRDVGSLVPLGLGAGVAAIMAIALLSGLRFAAERFLGLPSFT